MHLLQNFKELTVRPKNAQELKGLILQLALQGKLTGKWRKENHEIEPASELLKLIEREKAQLLKDKKIKKEKPLESIRKDEIPFEIPNNWKWSKLGELTSLINGDRGKNYPSKEHYIAEGIPFLTARNLGTRYLKHETLNYISEERYDLLQSGHIQMNDILYCLRGSLGKCSIVEGINKGAIASSLVIVRTVNPFNQIYLLNYFSSPLGTKMIYKYDNGTAQPNLSATDLKEFLVPLPPIEEQKAIVAIVETLFKEVDQLEQLTVERISLKEKFAVSALKQLTTSNTKKEWNFLQEQFHTFFNEKNNITKLRETVLQLAVQGNLTEKWRCENNLIKGEILKDSEKYEIDLIHNSPPSWNVYALGNVVGFQQGMQIAKSSRLETSMEGALPILKIKNYTNNFKTDVEWIKVDVNSLVAEVDDIILSRTGRVGRVLTGFKGVFHNNTFRISFPKDKLLSKYLQYFLQSSGVQNYIERVSGRTAQPDLTHKRFGPCSIVVPP
ncbi:MAG TPA: restriction endonuclease subunit S, partial [Flavobacterium sp.]|uniref:restriction endonuclease subunit S n=1 Tax=Flavobacterium sp. TaxID=239 RepID=UPI002DBEC5A5